MALRELILAIRAATDSAFKSSVNEDGNWDDDADPRDYALFVRMIEQSLLRDFVHASDTHRAGYLRALAHLFTHIADEVGPPKMDDWDPLSATEAAVVADRSIGAVLASARAI